MNEESEKVTVSRQDLIVVVFGGAKDQAELTEAVARLQDALK